MGEVNEEPDGRPATWENLIVGEAKEVAGRVTGDKALTEQGEEQVEIAHEVKAEYRQEHDHRS